MLALSATLKPPVVDKTEYDKLKTKLRRSTIGYGTAIASSYFITQGAAEGVSATLGAVTSLTYLNTLSKHVDEIENSPFQKQILIPVGAAIFERMWNHAPFSFDFDYGATFVGFLAYKFALTNVLYDVVREMLIEDSDNFYNTDEKEYIDYDDASSYKKL
tara:strand:- start:320 stop:799 length:480 start_codon:yes stop_codon:yes gene_type:complete